MSIFSFLLTPEFWFSVLRVATPVIFATIAANIAMQAGVFNLAIEGTMLAAALAGVLISAYTGSGTFGLLMGLIAGLLIGVVFGWALGFFALRLNVHIVISGIGLNLVAMGGTVFIMYTLLRDKGVTTALVSSTFPSVDLPIFAWIPVVGDYLTRVFSGHNILTYLSVLFAIFMWILLYKTPLGLKIRAVGENSDAAESVGIKVTRVQFIALTISGLMSALGGMFLSMGYLSFFSAGMVAGRGFLSIATDSMAMSNPVIGLFASLIYGFFDSISSNIAHVSQRFDMIFRLTPYTLIIILYAIYSFFRKKRNKEEFEF